MQQELKNFLDKNSDRILARISAEELAEIKQVIGNLTNEIVAANSEEKLRLLSLKFGVLQNSILHLAAKFGDEADVKKLLAEAPSDQFVNLRNDDFFTPLHFAAAGGHIAVARVLLAAAADKNAQVSERKRRWSPIHYAAQYGHAEMVEFLVKEGVDKETKTGFGLTPLLVGAEFGHANVVQVMLNLGADKNAQTVPDNQRMTALHYAVIGNFLDVATLLLNARINKETETTFGLTALEFAAKNNLAEMVTLLMSFGAGKWASALKIAQESEAVDVVNQIKFYQKTVAKIFHTTGLEEATPSLIKAIEQYNANNLGEEKIVLDGGVAFNAFGILALSHEVGLFKKVTKTFVEFAEANGSVELAGGLKKLNALVGAKH